LKKVQGKKKRDAEAAEVLKRQLAGAEAVAQTTIPEYGDSTESSNLLSTKDEDVIF
jgi:V-type H+-transporting ATPase subunit D